MSNIWILNHYASLDGHRHFELGRQFVQKGNTVTVIASLVNCPRSDELTDDYTYENINKDFSYIWLNVKPKQVNGSIQRVWSMFSYVQMVRKNLRIWVKKFGKPDVVIASSVHPLVWEAANYIKNKYSTKFICEIRDVWPVSMIEHLGISNYHPMVLFVDFINKRAFKRCDALVGTAKKTDQFVMDRYGKEVQPYYWIPNGCTMDKPQAEVSIEDEEKLNPILEYMDAHWCMVYAGSITKSEGVEWLVQAFHEFKKRYDKPISLVIIGEGNKAEKVRELIQTKNIKDVYMPGSIDRKYVPIVLERAQICVSTPRITERLGKYGLSMNKLSDYLLSGKPVLFAYDGFNVVKDAGAGFCVPKGNVKQFVVCLNQLYEMSEEERNRLGQLGIEEIKNHYAYEFLGEQYLKIIDDILQSKGGK